MNNLIPFTFENQQMRAIECMDGPWFVATDVADILGYRNAPDMTRNLDDDETATHILRSSSQSRNMTIISESGLYNAIFRSRREEAKAFRRWVTGTVLPQIRRTGCFVTSAPDISLAEIDTSRITAALAAVSLMRKMRGNGSALALWQHLGLPMPEDGVLTKNDDLADMIRIWVQGRDDFTNEELASGIGLGHPDHKMRRRFGDILRALGFESRKKRRGRSFAPYCWMRGE